MTSRTQLILTLSKRREDPAAILVKLALRQALKGCSNVLDIGCGASCLMRDLGVPKPIGLEAYPPSIERARRLKTHDQIVQGDVRRLLDHFSAKQFDACVALDLIEHLPKEDGLRLIREMEEIARKKVILLTPSGFLPQGHTHEGDLQVHLSGWDPSEMRGLGYRVLGHLGPKVLRGEHHILKYRPRMLWGLFSMAGHCGWSRWHPEHAAAILCVKTIEK